MLKAKPFGARRAMRIPIEARMVGKNLQASADNKKQQKQIEEVLPAQPRRKAEILNGYRVLAWIPCDEMLDGRKLPKLLGQRNSDDQEEKTDRNKPKNAVPLAA
jgi:hypothetical protein